MPQTPQFPFYSSSQELGKCLSRFSCARASFIQVIEREARLSAPAGTRTAHTWVGGVFNSLEETSPPPKANPTRVEQHSPQELSRSAERGKAQHICTEPLPSLRAGITPLRAGWASPLAPDNDFSFLPSPTHLLSQWHIRTVVINQLLLPSESPDKTHQNYSVKVATKILSKQTLNLNSSLKTPIFFWFCNCSIHDYQ